MVQTAYVTIISLDDHVSTLEEQIIDGGRSIAAAETGLPHSLCQPLRNSTPRRHESQWRQAIEFWERLLLQNNLRSNRGSSQMLDQRGASSNNRCKPWCYLGWIRILNYVFEEKNDGMETFVCELVPTLNLDDITDKVNQFYVRLKERGANNGIRIIQTAKLQTWYWRSRWNVLLYWLILQMFFFWIGMVGLDYCQWLANSVNI